MQGGLRAGIGRPGWGVEGLGWDVGLGEESRRGLSKEIRKTWPMITRHYIF